MARSIRVRSQVPSGIAPFSSVTGSCIPRRQAVRTSCHSALAQPSSNIDTGASQLSVLVDQLNYDEDAGEASDLPHLVFNAPANQALDAIRMTLREFRSLQEELQPWLKEHISRTGRKPSSADAELSGIPWVQDCFRRYALARQKLFMEIPSLAESLPGSQLGSRGSSLVVKKVNKVVAAKVRNAGSKLSQAMAYQQHSNNKKEITRVKKESTAAAAAAAAAQGAELAVADLATAATAAPRPSASEAELAAAANEQGGVGSGAQQGIREPLAREPLANGHAQAISSPCTHTHTPPSSDGTSASTTHIQPTTYASSLSTSPLTSPPHLAQASPSQPPPSTPTSAPPTPFLPSQRTPVPPPANVSSQGDDRIKSAFLSALSYRKQKHPTAPAPGAHPAHPSPTANTSSPTRQRPPAKIPKVIVGEFKQTGHRRARWLDEEADNLSEAAAAVAVDSPDFTASAHPTHTHPSANVSHNATLVTVAVASPDLTANAPFSANILPSAQTDAAAGSNAVVSPDFTAPTHPSPALPPSLPCTAAAADLKRQPSTPQPLASQASSTLHPPSTPIATPPAQSSAHPTTSATPSAPTTPKTPKAPKPSSQGDPGVSFRPRPRPDVLAPDSGLLSPV